MIFMERLSVEFDFKGAHYKSLIRVVDRNNCREYHIKILNRKLEKLLYGNHIVKERDGSLHADVSDEHMEQAELKLVIASELSNHLKKPCFAGEQLLMISDPLNERGRDLSSLPGHEPQHAGIY